MSTAMPDQPMGSPHTGREVGLGPGGPAGLQLILDRDEGRAVGAARPARRMPPLRRLIHKPADAVRFLAGPIPRILRLCRFQTRQHQRACV